MLLFRSPVSLFKYSNRASTEEPIYVVHDCQDDGGGLGITTLPQRRVLEFKVLMMEIKSGWCLSSSVPVMVSLCVPASEDMPAGLADHVDFIAIKKFVSGI